MKKIIAAGVLLGFFPVLALAQGRVTDIGGLLNLVRGILDALLPIVVALAVLYFFWGLAQYVLNSGDEEKRSDARSVMIWGIIIIFVMVSVWGLINVLVGTFGLDLGTTDIPNVPEARSIP